MFTFLSKEVRDGLEQARKQSLRKGNRLSVHSDGQVHRILRMWETGFELEKQADLRGLVDVYDGPRHVSHCLIVESDEGDGQYRYEFKRATPAREQAPVDFELSETAPSALIPRYQ